LQVADASGERHRFANVILRTGVSREFPMMVTDTWLRLQAGIQLRANQYRLDRTDAAGTVSRFHDSWMEWTHSAGMTIRTNDFELRYAWRLQSGTGRPGVQNNFTGGTCSGICFLPGASPSNGAVVLVPVRITTQQFSISVPMP